MKDPIERQDAIDYFVTNVGWRDEDGDPVDDSDELRKIWTNLFNGVPSAQQWIPVSERLPKNDDWVIVTILDEWGDTPWTYTDFGWYFEAANCWIVDAQQRTDVIAWMPIPEPWKGEE